MHWRVNCYCFNGRNPFWITRAASCIPLIFPSQPPCVALASYPEFRQQISHFFQNFISQFSLVQWQVFLYVFPFYHSKIFIYFSSFAVFPFTLTYPLLTTLTHFLLSSFPLLGGNAFRSVLESWQNWNGIISLEKSQRLLKFDVLMITF